MLAHNSRVSNSRSAGQTWLPTSFYVTCKQYKNVSCSCRQKFIRKCSQTISHSLSELRPLQGYVCINLFFCKTPDMSPTSLGDHDCWSCCGLHSTRFDTVTTGSLSAAMMLMWFSVKMSLASLPLKPF